jgi:hypothetical protein
VSARDRGDRTREVKVTRKTDVCRNFRSRPVLSKRSRSIQFKRRKTEFELCTELETEDRDEPGGKEVGI